MSLQSDSPVSENSVTNRSILLATIQWLKNHWLLVFAGFFIIGAGAYHAFGDESSQSTEEKIVAKPEVKISRVAEILPQKSLTTLGTVQSFQAVELRAESSGQVISITVEDGAQVEKGDILLELDHDILDAQVLQARADLNSALAQLNKSRNGERPENIAKMQQELLAAEQTLRELERGSRPEEVRLAEVRLENAKRSLENAESSLERAKEVADAELNRAQQALEDAQKTYNTTVNTTVVNVDNTFDAIDNLLREVVSSMDDVLFRQTEDLFDDVNNKRDELIFQPFVRDNELPTEELREKASEALENLKNELSRLDKMGVETEQFTQLNSLLNTAEMELRIFRDYLFQVNKLLNDVRQEDFTSLPEDSVQDFQNRVSTSRTVIDNLSRNVSARQQELQTILQGNESSLVGSQTQLNNAQVNLKVTQASQANNVVQAENRFIEAKNTVESLEQELLLRQIPATDEQLAIQRSTIERIRLDLAIAQTGDRIEDVQANEATVQRARANLAIAEENREKAIIRSPLTGTVIQVPFEVGDFINNGEKVAELADETVLEVITFITEEERPLIQVGTPIVLQNMSTRGVVTLISPALNRQTKKIEVKVQLTENFQDLVIGQTATVDFSISVDNQALLIPLEAIKLVDKDAFVLHVNTENRLESQAIQVDSILNERVLVKSGLTPESIIVVNVDGLEEGMEVEVLASDSKTVSDTLPPGNQDILQENSYEAPVSQQKEEDQTEISPDLLEEEVQKTPAEEQESSAS